MNKPNVVILGAGYGGLMTVTRLQKMIGVNEASITLVNKNDTHYESTWLHEAAVGTLTDERIQYPVSKVIDSNKVKFVQDTVVKINSEEKRVVLSSGELEYDYLVIALGFESETFGIPGLKEHALSISNVHSAKKIREHIELQFANYNTNGNNEDLTIVVGGAGFTGIEFLGELVNRIPELCKEHNVGQDKVKVVCVEASPTALPGFDPELVKYAVNYLENKGVEFKVGTAIKEAKTDEIIVAKSEETTLIKSKTLIWAAGVRGSHIVDESGFEAARGKVKVDNYLRVPGNEHVYVIGDCSLIINEETNRPYPPTAQIAMQQGELCAKNLVSSIRGNSALAEFKFDNKGTVCSLGEKDAVGVVFGKKVTGFPASFMKKMVDNRALFLIGGLPLVMKKGKFNIL